MRGAPNRWQIWKVKSHRRVEGASSHHDAWCIFDNDAADKKAKQANRERSGSFKHNHAQLLSAYIIESGFREKLCGLQQQVSQQARLSANILVKSGADVEEDLWSRQLGWLRMMQEDLRIDIPRAHVPYQPTGLLCIRHLQHCCGVSWCNKNGCLTATGFLL